MENLNTDQVLIWVLIFIALGAVAWAALQNWFFHQRNRYNQFPPNFPPYGAYPPYGGYAPQQGGDYPHLQTPRKSSPFLTLVLVVIAGIGLFKWVSTIKPDTVNQEQKKLEELRRDSFKSENAGMLTPKGKTLLAEKNPIGEREGGKIPDPYKSDELPLTNSEIPTSKPADPALVIVPETGFSIQVAALEDAAGFDRLAADLRERFPQATIFRHISEIAPSVYGDKLLIGRFKTREAALEGIRKLRKKGYKGCFAVDFEEIDMVEVYEL